MGICYSLIGGKRDTEQEGSWWKSNNNDNKINAWNKKSFDAKLKKSSSGDFASFIGKFAGGGGGSAADDRALHQIPGRLFGNASSSIASLYTQQGKKGTNQDAMIVWENFNSRSDTIFCGVFDGHGPYGHMVARRVRDSIPVLLCTEWIANSNSDQNCLNENGIAAGSTKFEECVDDDWCQSSEVEENEKLPEMYLPLKQSILKAFKLMDKELKLHPAIDCFCSGTTAVTLVKQGQDLIIGNVGDSRAVLATRDNDNSLIAVQLTIDLKPNLPREAARIQQCKGRVFALQDEPEVARVWLPNSDSPGLAMARAFGDFCLKDFGLISVPDVYYHRLTQRDEFVVLASDGVWDVLSNKEAVDIVASAPGRATAARALVDCATRAWRLKYPTSKNDDCAVVCLFLEHVSAPDVVQAENDLTKASEEAVQRISVTDGDTRSLDVGDVSVSHAAVLEHSGTLRDSGEIVPVSESTEEKLPERCLGQSMRSLAECLSTAEDEEWSALEGVTRVNSLLSLPRILSSDKRSTSWRKWL
uniref:protein-serine/threonine phosphatase n=1 Tax=Davidia involucrata TaxID=16924 RepID=A0A5B6ZJV7_DAVIN